MNARYVQQKPSGNGSDTADTWRYAKQVEGLRQQHIVQVYVVAVCMHVCLCVARGGTVDAPGRIGVH